MALPITGAATQNATFDAQPIALALPTVLKTDLADAADPLNDTRTGGKKPGGLYLALEVGAGGGEDVYTIVTAAGTEPTDAWIIVGAGTGSGATLAPVEYVTPA